MVTKNVNPLRIASGYTLHLYCKYQNPKHKFAEFPHEFFDENKSVAWRDARNAGWVIHRDRTATCPKCKKVLDRA